jgi:hypothetical protein
MPQGRARTHTHTHSAQCQVDGEQLSAEQRTRIRMAFDCRVHKTSNCFPMIPSGAAHTDMILSADQVSGTMDDEAKALV